jgi:hypothetical protein
VHCLLRTDDLGFTVEQHVVWPVFAEALAGTPRRARA